MKMALRARLRADSGVAAIAGMRVDWGLRPQWAKLPAVTLTMVAGGRDRLLGGAPDLAAQTVQADCWAQTYAEADALGEAVIAAIAVPATQGGIRFGNASVSGDRDLPEVVSDGVLHRRSIDLIVRWAAE
ncbi:tail completion protein gp17 [Allosphingosinicella indica]|uniref:DUF3168 domain-containing protein n=1 Tax=Allosphingosinicella indica TaxID=941907 RepID=A0A1X7GJ40_9SPHN|nr:DUF3168 domain-containing protein [Allosphingosinicella indica]SMF70523.1 Protein of unknown function [Allosphingosinicella indica]